MKLFWYSIIMVSFYIVNHYLGTINTNIINKITFCSQGIILV